MNNRLYDCSVCKKKYKDPERQKSHQKRLGCDGSVDPNLKISNQGLPSFTLNKCLGNYFNYQAMFALNTFPKYEKGIMPWEGGLYDQPAKFVELMGLIHTLKIAKEEELNRKTAKYRR